jgi:hypothetical protein
MDARVKPAHDAVSWYNLIAITMKRTTSLDVFPVSGIAA